MDCRVAFLLFLGPEVHEVQTDLGVGLAGDLAGDHVDDDFCSGADHGPVQMTAEAPGSQIAHSHVQMGIGRLRWVVMVPVRDTISKSAWNIFALNCLVSGL